MSLQILTMERVGKLAFMLRCNLLSGLKVLILTFLLLAQKKSKQKKRALNRTLVQSCTSGAAADILVGRVLAIRD